jgi:hypothetical protein
MIFPRINADSLVQVNDGLRIDARKTIFKDAAEIANVLISPEDDEFDAPIYISVYDGGDFDNWYLDWIYATEGEKTARVKVVLVPVDEMTPAEEKVISMTINVVTEAADLLFSKDSDILQSEPDILRYLPEGKTSFTFMHREAQRRILAFLDEQRIWKVRNERYTKEDIVDMEEFVHWSRFLVLHLIYAAKIVSSDDIFTFKANEYEGLMKSARGRSTLRLDTDGDDEVDTFLDRVSTIQVRR